MTTKQNTGGKQEIERQIVLPLDLLLSLTFSDPQQNRGRSDTAQSVCISFTNLLSVFENILKIHHFVECSLGTEALSLPYIFPTALTK